MATSWLDIPPKGEERRSSRVKYPISRLNYDNFMGRHYAYMSNVIKDKEPSKFKEAKVSKEW